MPDVIVPTGSPSATSNALGARRAATSVANADELALDAGVALGEQCSPAAELRLVEGDDPGQVGLQRRDAGTELVPVQRQPGLEPQRVASAEAGRHGAGVDDRRHSDSAISAGTAISIPGSPV